MSINKLILGDNIDILRAMDSETIDLIYLDPPFFSNRNYEVIWGDEGEVRSFQDRWAGGIEHYIAWLKERVIEMHRILKPTGSIFLHCDWHADAYIRVDILEKIFIGNFRSDIVWKRTTAHNTTSRKFGFLTDTIYFYSKSDNYYFSPPKALEHNHDYSVKTYRHNDEDGRLYRTHLIERNAALGIRPNLIYEYKGYTPKWGWMMEKEKLEKLDADGKLLWNSNGTPQRKIYLDEVEKPVLDNLWDDIPNVQSGKEKIGYPTQKPEALLERIIKLATKEGDIVLDPFVGGGTTVAVADKMGRNWIGIDQSVAAIKVSDLRLKNQQDLYSNPYELVLRHYDYDFLRHQDAFEFEKWIIEQFGGIANPKQRNDFGLDGRMFDNTPIQVKRSDNIGRNVIDNFFAAIQRSDKNLFEKNKKEKKPVGYIIAFSFGKGAYEEVARLKNKEHIIIELKKVSDIVTYGKPPKVTLTANELEQSKYAFEATAESEIGIEFYSWDFNHKTEDGFKADIYLDKVGKQVRKLKPGEHQIAVEAVDKSGLDSMDKIKLKVNGRIEPND